MPDFAHNKETGELWIRDSQVQDWRPASDAEREVAESPIASSVLSFLIGATPLPMPVTGDTGQERLEALSRIRSGAETAGAISPIVGLGAIGGLRAFGAKQAGVSAQGKQADALVDALESRAAAGSVSPIGQAAGAVEEGAQAGLRSGAQDLQSVGAAQVGGGAKGSGVTDRIINTLFEPRALTTTQARIVGEGAERMDELGYRLMPGQRQGQNLLVAGAKSDPLVAQAFDPIFNGNRVLYNKAANRVLGLEASEQFGRRELGQAASAVGDTMDEIAENIGTTTLDDSLMSSIQGLKRVQPELDLLLELPEEALEEGLETVAKTAARTIEGEDVMALRSLIADTERQAWRQGETLKARAAAKVRNQIEKHIEDSLSAADLQKWGAAKEKWRFLLQMEKPGSFKDNIGLSPNSLANKFNKEFIGDFRRSEFAVSDRLSQEGKDFLDLTKIASAFSDNIGDSGTASRLGIQNLLQGGVKGIMRRVMLRTGLRTFAERPGSTPRPPQ